jgi:hypothetical protein
VRKKPVLRFSRRILLAGFAAGLLLGGLFGLLFMPIDWSGLLPPGSNSSADRAYLARVALNYSLTHDNSALQRDLAGWDPNQVKALLSDLEQNTTDPQTRQSLLTLDRALRVPAAQPSLTDALLGNPVFIMGLLLSFAPVLGMAALLTVPHLLKRNQPLAVELQVAAEEASSEAELDAQIPEEVVVQQEAEPADGDKTEARQEESTEESGEADTSLGDLASLFEEEDNSLSALDTLCKNLPTVAIDELLTNVKDVLDTLKRSNAQVANRRPK